MKYSRYLIQYVALLSLPGIAMAALNVQVVDDSSDSSGNSLAPYFLIVGQPVTTGGDIATSLKEAPKGPVVNVAAASAETGMPVLVSSLPSAKNAAGKNITTVSPYTGRTLNVQSFTISSISAAAFMAFYGNADAGSPPFTYQNNANPSALTSNFRFDQVELTYDKTIQSGVNLTSIDAYSIPMQLDVFAANDTAFTTPLHTNTYYLSTESIIRQMAQAGMTSAIQTIGSASPAYNWSTGETLSSFARIVSPGLLASDSSQNYSPSPFPSFSSYLGYLLKQQQALPSSTTTLFSIGGNASNQSYLYNATISSDGSSGYNITLTGTLGAVDSTTICPSGCSSGQTIVINLPASSNSNPPSPLTQANNMDATIYGAALNAFTVGGTNPCLSAGATSTCANTVYGAIVRDTLAAINFGYVGGCTGSTSSVDWFGAAPFYNPFGMARPPCATTAAGHPNGNPTNDGYYNPWAAFFYNNSDAYGNAFSDRNNAQSPLLSLQDGQTLRITILPDRRLDAPVVTARSSILGTGTPQACSIGLSWQPIANATGYSITINPGSYSFYNGLQTSTSIEALSCGTPYMVKVAATGVSTVNKQPISSPARTLQVVTPGSASVSTGPINFQTSFSFAQTAVQNVPGTASVNIGGQTLFYDTTDAAAGQWTNNGKISGIPAQLTGNTGLNQYVVTLNEPGPYVSGGQTVYPSMQLFSGIMSVNLTGPASSYTVTSLLSGNASASGGGAITYAGGPGTPPYSSAFTCLVTTTCPVSSCGKSGCPQNQGGPATLGIPFVPRDYPKAIAAINYNPQ